ncbi:MAG: hypothetical protein IJU92_10165 [Spirochaetaceae bacterium]|nr:hypothetical protein [Spirochaetaceae bacterium]
MVSTKLVSSALDEALSLFRKGDFLAGQAQTEKLLTQDLDNEDLKYLNRCIAFWGNRFDEVAYIQDPLKAGEHFVTNWAPFLQYMQKDSSLLEPFIFTFKTLAFRTAVMFYSKLYRPEIAEQEPFLCRRIGLCFKALGDYEQAVDFLYMAYHSESDNPKIIAELADAFALYGETKRAKVFFRDAFYEGASEIELEYLESHLILDLVASVSQLGYRGNELLEWLPVYGYIDRTLSIKRELKAAEVGKLKQRIFMLESELRRISEDEQRVVLPKLINSYLWLMDTYSLPPIDEDKIKEILLKIKVLNINIYKALECR